jgi:hypothetical protein
MGISRAPLQTPAKKETLEKATSSRATPKIEPPRIIQPTVQKTFPREPCLGRDPKTLYPASLLSMFLPRHNEKERC